MKTIQTFLLFFWKTFLTLGLIFLASISLLSFWGNHHFYLELLSHFRFQYFLLAFGFTIFCFIFRYKKRAFAFLILASINSSTIFAYFLPKNTPDPSIFAAQTTRLLFANVLTQNTRSDFLIDLIQKENPHIVVLQETNNRWLQELSLLDSSYPYRLVQTREDNFGIAILSKLPLTNKEILFLGDLELPSLKATISINNQKINLLSTHPIPPISKQASASRNQQIKEVGLKLKEMNSPKLLIGDLNLTAGSYYFEWVSRDVKLKNARHGFGWLPSWPSQYPFLLRIPIDHCLVSSEIEIIDFRLGPNIGSDHLPIIIDFALKTKNQNEAF